MKKKLRNRILKAIGEAQNYSWFKQAQWQPGGELSCKHRRNAPKRYADEVQRGKELRELRNEIIKEYGLTTYKGS